MLKVNRKRIFYCDRKLKYGSSVSEVKDVERSGKKMDVILENEMRLTIYDIEEEGRKITWLRKKENNNRNNRICNNVYWYMYNNELFA